MFQLRLREVRQTSGSGRMEVPAEEIRCDVPLEELVGGGSVQRGPGEPASLGRTPGPVTDRSRRLTEDERAEIAAQVAAGRYLHRVAREFGVSVDTVRYWGFASRRESVRARALKAYHEKGA